MRSSAQDVFDVQGHRGARGLLPENTVPAFLRALDLGVTTLEMDVVVSSDGVLIVSHEPWMSAEICTHPDGSPVQASEARRLNIFGMTAAEAARYDCGRRGHPRFPRQQPMPVHKPTLDEVVQAAEAHARAGGLPPVRYNIETKARPDWDGRLAPPPEPFAALLHAAIVRHGLEARATVQSFDARTLRATRRLDPALATALLTERREPGGVAGALERLGFTPAVYSPAFALVDAALVAEVHARGMRLLPWTVNERADMERLAALGVDGLITDYPDVAARPQPVGK